MSYTKYTFSKDILQGKCGECNFIFFSHYPFKIECGICPACESSNENTRTVRSWEN